MAKSSPQVQIVEETAGDHRHMFLVDLAEPSQYCLFLPRIRRSLSFAYIYINKYIYIYLVEHLNPMGRQNASQPLWFLRPSTGQVRLRQRARNAEQEPGNPVLARLEVDLSIKHI